MTVPRSLSVLLVIVLFVVLGFIQHRRVEGEDLTSSYVGCRILVSGKPAHLYSHDPMNFNVVLDPLWIEIGKATGIQRLQDLHPYVQTPLWAYALKPVCAHFEFRSFYYIFIFIIMLCSAGTIWLVAKEWAPALVHPGWLALICFVWYLSEPYKYALYLAQTHIIFIFLTVCALVLDRRNRPIIAGVLLAIAASVKITPGFLLLYWLAAGRKKAAYSFIVSFVVLNLFGMSIVGSSVMTTYLQNLAALSKVLLVSMNNQSFAAWYMAHLYPSRELFQWRSLPLPVYMSVLCLFLSSGAAVYGGVLDRSRTTLESSPPYGAAFVMVGTTIFAPIAWTHYFIVLVIPVMLMLSKYVRSRYLLWAAVPLIVFALSLYPVTHGAVLSLYTRFPKSPLIPYLVRGQFYAGLLCLLSLLFLANEHKPLRRSDPQ